MEDFKYEENVRRLYCEHCYHEQCIIPWLQMVRKCNFFLLFEEWKGKVVHSQCLIRVDVDRQGCGVKRFFARLPTLSSQNF